MHFIEALKLKSKLFFIFIIIAVGLIFVGIMGAMNLNSMKKNLDSLYFGSLMPVIELNNILQIYHGSLYTVIYQAKNGHISQSEAEAEIKSSVQRVNSEWKSYESHFKRYEELPYVEYTASEIKTTNEYFNNILKAIVEGYDLQDLSMDDFEDRVEHIHQTVDKLISYEIDVAKYERKKFLHLYDSMLIKVSVVLFLVVLSVMIISYYVFKSIQVDQKMLEVTTKKLKITNKKLESASYTDSLTGLYNRRYFNLIYERELKRAKRTNSLITFMMMDIDYFKQYNDAYGHLEGDMALKSVAKILKDLLKRPGDFVFRLGGEEFGVLVVDTCEINSAKLAQDICDHVRESEIKHKASGVSEFLTISIGVACCVADDMLGEETLMTKADEMLYIAKERGRDRYEITSEICEAKSIAAEI